jgi:hypothetical protein
MKQRNTLATTNILLILTAHYHMQHRLQLPTPLYQSGNWQSTAPPMGVNFSHVLCVVSDFRAIITLSGI